MPRRHDLAGEAEPFQQLDQVIGRVDLPPPVLVRGAGLIVVVVVVPTLADGNQADQPVIAAVIVGLVIAVAEQVRKRIDRPGYVPDDHGTQEDAPDQEAQAELQPGRCIAGLGPADSQAGGEEQRRMGQIDCRPQQNFLFQAQIKRILENVPGVLVIRGDRLDRRIVTEQPAAMAPRIYYAVYSLVAMTYLLFLYQWHYIGYHI